MFDIGGWEFLLIGIIAIIVVGPKELPGAIRTMMSFVRRARELARDFQSGLEDVAREVELDKLGADMKEMVDPGASITGLRNEIEGAIDPDSEIRHAMDFDREWTDDELADYPSASEIAEREVAGAQENTIAPPTPDAPADPAPASGEAAPDEAAEKHDTKAGKPA